MSTLRFHAFDRGQGGLGARNYVAIVSVMDNCNPATRSIAQQVSGSIAVTTLFVRGQFGDDLVFTYGVLARLSANPNVHGVVLVGLEDVSTDKVATLLRKAGKQVKCVNLQPHGTTACIAEGVRLAREMVLQASEAVRDCIPISMLSVGIVSSCVTQTGAQILHASVGNMVNALVLAGARVMLSQAAGLVGVQDAFVARALRPTVAIEVRAAFQRMQALPGAADALTHERMLSQAHLTLFGEQAVRSVLGYGQPPDESGLHWMPTPRGVAETFTAFAAAGCQVLVHVLDTGPALAGAVAPTLCVGTNKNDPALDIRQDAQDLVHQILEIASGTSTRSELLGLGQTAISRFARSG